MRSAEELLLSIETQGRRNHTIVLLHVMSDTKLYSSTHLRCLLVALLDVLIVRLRRLLAAASVRLRILLGMRLHCPLCRSHGIVRILHAKIGKISLEMCLESLYYPGLYLSYPFP